MVSTTIICSLTPRVSLPSFIIGGTYGVGDALKSLVTDFSSSVVILHWWRGSWVLGGVVFSYSLS
ncbi:unnamed protein product [Prunus armeniaca]